MVYVIKGPNKRDLEEEQRVRKEKKEKPFAHK